MISQVGLLAGLSAVVLGAVLAALDREWRTADEDDGGCVSHHEWEDVDTIRWYGSEEWRAAVSGDVHGDIVVSERVTQKCKHCGEKRHEWRGRVRISLRKLVEAAED